MAKAIVNVHSCWAIAEGTNQDGVKPFFTTESALEIYSLDLSYLSPGSQLLAMQERGGG